MARKTVARRPLARPDEPPAEPREDAPAKPPIVRSASFIAALDVDYSNLKLLAGERGTAPAVTVLPAGAGPATAMPLHPQTAPGRAKRNREDGLAVEVDGAAWAAGVEQSRLQNWERELHPRLSRHRRLPRPGLCRPACVRT